MEATALLLTDDRSSLSPSSPGQDIVLKIYLVPYIEAERPRNITQLSAAFVNLTGTFQLRQSSHSH